MHPVCLLKITVPYDYYIDIYIYIHGWVRRRHVSEKHRHPGPIGATLIMRLEGIPKLFWKNNAILQPKHELAW